MREQEQDSTPGTGPAQTWSELDTRAVDVARALALDAVEAAGSGHPGTAVSLAPLAHLLYSKVMRHDPSDPQWLGRDRFVLSCGHTSLTLYTQLYLTGYGVTLDDLGRYRQLGSATPGHPEVHHTPGVETTTGPLGQGLATAVGMAMGQRRARTLLDPDAPAGESHLDVTTWVICSDGDMQEGISHEAASLAGVQALSNLVVFYDENSISIEGDTALASRDDAKQRFEAYGWNTLGPVDVEDTQALWEAARAARAESERPTLVLVKSVIAAGAPHAAGTAKSHGSPLGAEEVAATKAHYGLDPERTFQVPEDVLAHTRNAQGRGRTLHAAWDRTHQAWAEENPEGAVLLARLQERRLPAGWEEALPQFPADEKGMATREASGKVLAALEETVPELWGGSADLAGSNNTRLPKSGSFLPESHPLGDPSGRNVHYGIREHAMGAAMNGIALEGLTRTYGGTFLVFSDYMRGAVRLAAIMGTGVTYVWTHDSIGLGEDGPTHQPIEHLAALRAMPGIAVVRPSDANETVEAWRRALEDDTPVALCLSRQKVPTLDRDEHAPAAGTRRGAYTLVEADDGAPEAILLATGSEVTIALAARELLQEQGTPTRVVAAPCLEWFEEEDQSYQRTVLPPEVSVRVSVEAGVAQPWWKLLGTHGQAVSLETFGASGPVPELYEHLGMTAERVVAAVHASQSLAGKTRGAPTGN